MCTSTPPICARSSPGSPRIQAANAGEVWAFV
jgi:hypothetical protein